MPLRRAPAHPPCRQTCRRTRQTGTCLMSNKKLADSAPRQLDDWVVIEPDGRVTIFSGKVELGTGVSTALAQIAAEELDVSLESIRLVMGDTGRTPDEGHTTGSKTLQIAGAALRHAAAE